MASHGDDNVMTTAFEARETGAEPKSVIDRTISTSTSGAGEQLDLAQGHQLRRGLKSRHIQFMALGGAIGTGLFIGSGQVLAAVGPAPLFMSYIIMMIVVWDVMNVLAEMTTYLPMKGISIPYFVSRFVEPSLAFATGWNYWYAYAILIAAESTAGAIIFQYWTHSVNVAVWIAIQLIVILFLNIVAVSWFGEAEFWFASIKLITIVGIIILSIVLFFGGGPDHDALYFKNWRDPPGAFVPFLSTGSLGRFLAFWMAFARAGFSFITSPELIALSAGETMAPRRNIPKAARRFTWRLLAFYGFGSLAVGVLVPNDNPRLLSPESNASASPFVIGIQRAGIPVLNHIINAAVLTSAWSAGNAFCFSGSRVLYSMALNGQAPRLFTRTSRRGVPYVAVLFTLAIGALAFLNVSNKSAVAFQWFSNISTISGYIAWIVVMITYLRFRKAMAHHGMLDALPFRTPFQPYMTYFILFLVVLLTLTNGFQVFVPAQWSVSDFLASYITIPIFMALYLGHKIWFRTPFARRPEDVDVSTGKKEMDELEEMDEKPAARNWAEKAWFWLA
ncbi:amino-acid permease inda1 [Xylaria sp. CBS 124048]|nr:amino-acid permease inda1 [Xylaria sp. CBS 124048]